MGCDSCPILLKPADVSLIPLDFLREEFQQPVFQPVLLALVICFHQAKTCHVHIQIHLFLDRWITGTQCLDFRVGQRCLVDIFAGADRSFAGHDLRNEVE